MSNITNSINSVSVRFTRNDYMSNRCSHAEYYGQFDSPAVRNAILRVIPMSDLMASFDPYMNDIKLSRWDSIRFDRETLRNLTIDGHTHTHTHTHTNTQLVRPLSDIVCLTKTIASRMVSEM